MKKSLFLLLLVTMLLVVSLAGCNLIFGGDNGGEEEYKIIFTGTSIPSITIKNGDTITMPQDPTAEGRIFGGWFVDSQCTIPFNQAYLQKNPLTGDLHLYPKWIDDDTATKVTLTLDVNGGKALANAVVSVTEGLNVAQQLPIPTKGGADFVGWFDSEVGGTKVTDADALLYNYTSGDATLYAHWEEATYDIILSEVNGEIGTISGGKTGASYLEEITVTAVTNDEHYDFIGWFNGDQLLSDSLTYVFEAVEDVTLTAKWLGEERTLLFHRNYMGSDLDEVAITFNYGGNLAYTPARRAGYSFIGWYDNAECVGTPISENGNFTNLKLENNTILYAKWTEGHDELIYNPISATEVEVIGVKATAGSIIHIPSTWSGLKVSRIGANAFKNSTKSAIVIPSSVEEIDATAFVGATSKIYLDRGVNVNVLNSGAFSDAQEIYFHLFNEGENALIDDVYVEANGIFADTQIGSKEEGEAFYSYVWLYTYTEKFTLTIDESLFTGDFADAMMGENGLFKNLSMKLMLKSNTAQSYSYGISGENKIYFNFSEKTSNFVATGTTSGGKLQIQARSLTQVSTLGEEHELAIDYHPEYLVYTSEQLVYAVEHGYKPIFGVGSTVESIYNKARTALTQIINDEMSEYQKIAAIHDYIALNVTYDSALLNLSTSNSAETVSHYRGFNLEGVFEDGKAVCDGITKAFMLMCRMEGIEAIRVSGSLGAVGHAWNKVCVDGVWYAVDVTNDDSIMSIGGYSTPFEMLTHRFFMVSDAYLSATHDEDDDSQAPIATGSYDYFANTKYDGINDLIITSQVELNLFIHEVKAMSNATDKFYYGEVKFNVVNPTTLDYSGFAGYSYLPYASGSKAHYSIGNGIYLLNFLKP